MSAHRVNIADKRFASDRYSEMLALTDSIMHNTEMASEYITITVDKIAGDVGFPGVFFDKSGIISVRYESYVLAVMPVSVCKAVFSGDLTYLRLCVFAERELYLCEPVLR